jgi:hypothetical protein
MLFLMRDSSQAVPSYARQTGLPCNSCHIVFPELNSFGRRFKLEGYTLVSGDTIDNKGLLKLLKTPPVAAMGQISFTGLKEREPGTQNNNFEFPQQLSLFLSGEITPRLGSFIQFTYDDQSGSFGWDNTDIRFARRVTYRKKDLIYGVTLNNNPTVQDVWNSTPAWGFPYARSGFAPTPSAATLIDGGLAQDVLGLGVYGFYNNLVYAEFSLYRLAQQGSPQPPDATSSRIVRAVSPYWRAAVQHQWASQYLEFGTYGLSSRIYPAGVSGSTDNYTDAAIDTEYHATLGNKGDIVAHATWIHERQELNASFASGAAERRSNSLNYVSMPSTISIAEIVNAFKSNSSRWIRQTFPNRRWFSWQEGYGAFSVSRSQEEAVIEYIRNQQEHHRRQDFQQELLELLRRHGIEYDPRYVFD